MGEEQTLDTSKSKSPGQASLKDQVTPGHLTIMYIFLILVLGRGEIRDLYLAKLA